METHAHRLLPGSVELGDFDPTLDRDRARSRAASWRTCRARALDRTFERYWESFAERVDGAESWDALHALRAAQRRARWCASASATRALELLDCLISRPAAGRLEPVGGDRLARSRRRRASSATCRTPGSGRASSRSRAHHASPTSASRISALVLAAGVPPAWLADGKRRRRCSACRRYFGVLSYTLERRGRRTRSACSSPATSACRRAASCSRPPLAAAAARRSRVNGKPIADLHRRRSGRQRAAGDGRVRFVSAAGDADATSTPPATKRPAQKTKTPPAKSKRSG